ncbi:MAG TPA: copper resistance protein CopC [Streptosporangiaceae bacterium]|nr:copper resistance protein CopC [Streptosporangiaceae bacterium]
MADRPRTRWSGRLVAAAALAALLGALGLLATARPAAASAFLVAATPARGAVVTTAPPEVLLTFSEPVEVVGDGAAVVGPGGDRVDPGTVRRPRPEVVAVPLPGVVAVTRQGTYTVAWHVVSADARPARGSFTFGIGAAPAAARISATGPAPVVAGAYGLAAFAALAGLTLLAGGVVLGRYGGPAPERSPRPRHLVMAGWTVLAVATVTLVALRGPYAAGAGLERAADRDLLGQTLHSHYGRALAVRLILLGGAAALLAWAARRPPGRDPRRRVRFAATGVVAAGGLALTWAAVSDAATAGAPGLLAGVVQVLATATWLGALVAVPTAPGVLAASRRRRSEPPPEPPEPPEPPAAAGGAAGGVATSAKPATTVTSTALVPPVLARRFGRLTAACVALIIISGGYLEWHALGGAAAPATTTYGRLLAIKIVLLGGALALSVWIRRGLRAPAGPGAPGGAPRPIAAAGTVLVALVLALSTALAEVEPAALARAARPATAAARFDAGGDAGTGVLRMRLPRTLRGVDQADLTFLSGGRPRDLAGPRAAWTQPVIGVGPLPVRFTRVGTGRYRLDWPPLPVAGPWRLRLTSGSGGGAAVVSVRVR